jgi:cell division protease FtsH
VLDTLAGELLEKETLHRAELEGIFSDVKKRPRLTMFDDFGGRVPSDKPPIKTPGELAIERGEPWPKPVPEPAFKAAIAQASREAAARQAHQNGTNGSNPSASNGVPANAPTQPDYGAPAGWHAPGWPPPPQQQQQQPPAQHPQGYWYPPQHWHNPNVPAGAAPPPYPPYQPYPQPGHPAPQGTPPAPGPKEDPDQDTGRSSG